MHMPMISVNPPIRFHPIFAGLLAMLMLMTWGGPQAQAQNDPSRNLPGQASPTGQPSTAGAKAQPNSGDSLPGTDHPLHGQPGVRIIGVAFSTQPLETGMQFDRSGAQATTIQVQGKQEQAWQVSRSNVPQRQWERAFRFRITDQAFVRGGRPAVDVRLQYMLNTWAGVDVFASTMQGWKKVATGWGDTKGRWRTLQFRMDNAWFGPTSEGLGGQSPDGFDLLVVGANAPLLLRQIELVGYDPHEHIHWPRLLRIDAPQPENHQDRLLMVFGRRADNAILTPLTNLAKVDRELWWRFRVMDWMGTTTLHQDAGKLTLSADATSRLPLAWDASQWRLGPYEAWIELRLNESDVQPLLKRRVRLGIIDDGPWGLPKAAEDAPFFYGLDAGNTHATQTATPVAAAWYRLMGVDVLRNLPLRGAPDSREKIQDAIMFLRAQDLRAMYHVDPPKPGERDAAWREAEVVRRAQRLAWAIESFGGRGLGQLPFAELGNEPDLPFFWSDKIDTYLPPMTVLARTAQDAKIKAGLAADQVLIANGGLSFAGREGQERSRRFLQLVPAGLLDAIAFHAHGPGLGAEQHAYERLREAMAGTQVQGLPVFDTESGFNGTSQPGLLEQARTAVQKLAYAQSVNMPTLCFFRLFMESSSESGYGMTDHLIEPRPSVLAYRQMVRLLRGHRLVKVLDAPAGDTSANTVAYLFHEHREGRPDGWALLAFNTRPAQTQRTLRLADPKDSLDPVRDPVMGYDLFGNDSPANLSPGHLAGLSVGVDPVYLTWSSDTSAQAIQWVPSPLSIKLAEGYPTGHTSAVTIVVRNEADTPLPATLQARLHSRVASTVQPDRQELTLPPQSEKEFRLEVVLGEADMPLSMPRWWRLFADVAPDSLDALRGSSIPDQLVNSKGIRVSGQQVWTGDHRLDFDRIFNGYREKRPVVGFAYLDSPADVTVPVAASADWWMAWYVNGQQVYSTLDRGNNHGSLADHLFDLPLHRGRNVVAFQCLSGSGGWSLQIGGPRERALVLSAAEPADQLLINLVDAQGQMLAQQRQELILLPPLPGLHPDNTPSISPADRNSLALWMPLEPHAVAAAESVRNFLTEQPDASRWYAGPDDLSATLWLRTHGDQLEVCLLVQDDQHEPPNAAESTDKYDSLKVSLRDHSDRLLLNEELWEGQGHSSNQTMPADPQRFVQRITTPHGKPATIYRLAIGRELMHPSGIYHLELVIRDRDDQTLKQHLTLKAAQLRWPAGLH